jgi:hypothetical protein
MGFNNSREGNMIGALHGKVTHSHIEVCVGADESVSLKTSQLCVDWRSIRLTAKRIL